MSNARNLSNLLGSGTTIATAKIADDAVTSAKIADDAVVSAAIADDAITSALIADNSVGAAALNVSGNGTSGQAFLSDGDGSFSYGAGGDQFGTENGTYKNSGTFSGSFSANTIRTQSIAAGRYFVVFTSSAAVQFPNSDPDGVSVQYREDGTAQITHSHEETSDGPVSSRTTIGVRTFSSTVSVTVHVPAGGDSDPGGLHLHTMLKLIKLD